MHSGAISRNDISASHWWVTFNTISKGGTNLIKLQPKSHVDNLSFPYFLEIMFRQVTIITGYHLNHVSNSMNFEGHYYGYSYINGNTADFQFILSTRQLLINRIPSNGSVNYRFETPVKARNFRIYFLPTYVFQIKVATMQFEIYVCPHWNYAKPLGMSSGLISKQRIMSYANKQRSNPYLARLDSQGFGWQPLDSAGIQKNIGNAKYWLQIVLPALKKVIYIIVQGSKFNSNLRTNYWIQYGRDENLLTTYKILPPPYGAFLNATHVFSTPLIASIIRYIPVLPRISKPRVKIELYGVDYLTPDHNWKLVLPHSFTDSIQFEDLRPTNRIWPKAAFSYLRRHQKYPHLRTEELPSNDCLINPDFCKDGFTASFGFSDIEKWKLPKSHEAFVISKYYDGTCEQLTLEKNLTINSMFGIHFNSIQLQRFQTVHSLLHMRGYFPNSNLIIQAFVNQNTSYVENCLYGKAPHQYILKGKFKFSSKRIDISNFLQRIGNSKAWKYGTSLSLVIEPTAANYLGVMISSSLSLSIFPACHSHKTNIITQLPNSNFQQQSDTDCHQLPHLVKFSEKGYQSCNHNEIVQINLMKQYLITALKVAGVKQLIHTDLNVTTSFKIEYSRNNIAWETFSLDFERKIIHPEKTEITPLPHPVYMQYLKIIPNKDKYVGTNHGLRFDVITCDNAESQQSGWIKLNSADVCVGVKDESPGRFTLLNNVDISFVKFVHKSGGVACAHGSSQTNFGCGSTMLIFLTDGSNKVILPSLSNNGYEVPPYDPNSPNFQLKLNEPRFFQYGQEFAVWFGEDLFNVTENDNHGSTCLDLYGWGRPYPHRSLMTTKLQTTYLCVTVSSDTLIVDSHCEDSFFMTTEMYLVHANSGKCVMRDCSTNSCEVRVVQECSHEFEIVEGFVKHTQSGQYLVEHNGKVVLASSCDGNCFILTDSVEFLNTEIWEHYFSNNLLMSKKGASNTDDAARKCSQHNSDLLSIHSKEEALAIFNFLRTSDLNYQYMIGLKKIATSNVYSWIDGTPFDKDKFDGMKGNMSATNNPCIIMHDGKLHILECHSRKFICKKKFYSIPEFSVPLLSSGLHSVDNYHEGKGFQVNLAFFHKFYLSATVESDHSSCYASYNLPNKVEYNVNLFGITWSKLKKELKLYLDGKSVISVACIDLSSFHRIVRKPIEPSMSNFINIAGFYDHLASYGSSNYRSILNDVKVWRIYLTDDQFYDDYSSNKITFSENYRAVDDKSPWKLQNTCGVNKNVPCYDVDMSLAKLTDCVWLDGGPVGDFNLAFNTLDETRCIYKCYLERNKIGSINGVSYANKQCYCVSDMYDINDTMRHQKSCFLPVKVTNGRQTVQKSMKNIKIHPVNKMWYGIGDDSFIYRHPARTSPNVDLWKKVIAMCAVIKFDIFERNIWILCNNHSLYQWFNKDHIVKYNGKYRDIAVGKDFFYGVGKITYSLYYIPYAISKTPTSISNKAIHKKLSIDAYNSRCYILTMDGNIKFVSDKNNTKSHDLPAVEDISQIATSIFGNLYINNGRNIKILNNDKYDDVQLTDSNMVSFTAFDVENDEYLIGMNENGVLHQYTISTSEKIVLYANASQTNMTAIHRTNNHSSCDSSLIKVNAMQTAVVFTFAVGIQQDVIINTAFIHLNINEINKLSTSASYKITTLWQSPQDIVGCEHIVAEENHNLVKPVSWSVKVLRNVITTADVSSLIQHAVNHGHWFHGRYLYVTMIPDADNDVNLEFDIRAAYLEVFYANQKPNNYLHIPTSALPYTSFQTDYYLPNHQYLTFWLYMSEKGSAILMVWKIYYWYTHRNTMLCRAKNKDFTKGWKQINVPLYSTSYFKLSFQVYHRDRSGYGDVAIDNIHVFKDLDYSGVNKITKDYQSFYDPANYTSYIAVMKTLNLPTPLLLYPLALPEYYLQDYGPHHLHLVDDTIDSKVRVHFPDKYGMWDHCVQLDELDSKLGLFNLDIYSAVVAIKTEWAFLFHFYPLYVDKSIKIVQFGIQGDLISINMKQNRLYIVMQSNAEFIEEVFPLAVNKNKWAYVGVTYSAGRMKLFKNNKLEKEFDLPLTFAIPFPQSIHFFSNDKVHEVFKGYLSCFQLYNKSLTLAEVRALEFCPNRQGLFFSL
ncbi:uncharacterized protein LOC130655125 [Hydractinia symbiolongicarpus]|uniref:uncharacterized protein LOC130655125 n=1 Tax=Hydractinia symbiolongicarpus TaxID=13093 RepID=UPI00254DC273|nr:uncharacterized protein LOC130655125 [Hydractinia symbiolongicarpus]